MSAAGCGEEADGEGTANDGLSMRMLISTLPQGRAAYFQRAALNARRTAREMQIHLIDGTYELFALFTPPRPAAAPGE
jgi:hypothetical protein